MYVKPKSDVFIYFKGNFRLQITKASVPKDAISDSLKKIRIAPFQVALPWHPWRTMTVVGIREGNVSSRSSILLRINFSGQRKIEIYNNIP